MLLGVGELGIIMAELSRRGLSISGINLTLKRGEKIVRDNGYKLTVH
jgi:hypothetical protein